MVATLPLWDYGRLARNTAGTAIAGRLFWDDLFFFSDGDEWNWFPAVNEINKIGLICDGTSLGASRSNTFLPLTNVWSTFTSFSSPWRHRKHIAVDDDEVGEFSGFQGALAIFFKTRVGSALCAGHSACSIGIRSFSARIWPTLQLSANHCLRWFLESKSRNIAGWSATPSKIIVAFNLIASASRFRLWAGFMGLMATL